VGRTQHHPKADVVVTGCRDRSCCDRRSARCYDCCSTSRRERPFQTAWPDVATRPVHDSEKRRRGGSLPRTPFRVSAPEGQSSEEQRPGLRLRGRTQHHPKADAVATVVGNESEAIGAARDVTGVVPRAAANDPFDVRRGVECLAFAVVEAVWIAEVRFRPGRPPKAARPFVIRCRSCRIGRSRWPENSRQRTYRQSPSRHSWPEPGRRHCPMRKPHPATHHEPLSPTQVRWAAQPATGAGVPARQPRRPQETATWRATSFSQSQ
jgi:hypothetical protein